jgi:hypothetical protein
METNNQLTQAPWLFVRNMILLLVVITRQLPMFPSYFIS